ncbi:hypothetical protein KR018_002859 [Drosophila ironensis]|nr:hypothetical protein KR018_002859 [Drosophila ironensis]
MFWSSFITVLLCCIMWAGGVAPDEKGIQFQYKSRRVQIPNEMYFAIEKADNSKLSLQNKFHYFLESLQKNLSMSTVFSDFVNSSAQAANCRNKIHELYLYFYETAHLLENFAIESEKLFDIFKNESYLFLLKLRQVPKDQPTRVKNLLTNYFSEMEFFHVLFSEVIDEALEYTTTTLKATQQLYIYYAEAQYFVLKNWMLKQNLECCKLYAVFLHHHSAKLFNCAVAENLKVTYDIYALTKINAKYIMQQLEFRIQRVLNCFLFASYTIRCRFLFNADQDFESLFSKLAELEMYLDIKIKRDFIVPLKPKNKMFIPYANIKSVPYLQDCIPTGFPQSQMSHNLKQCFYFVNI